VLSHLSLAWSKQTRSSPSQHGQGRSDCQNGLASTQEGKANTWGRAREEDPQEGPFNKDGSQKDRLTEPFHSAKKPWNKPGSGHTDQITYPTEGIAKLKKKLQKPKRHSKKHARESTDNDSDDNLDTGSSSTGSLVLVDERIKLEQSLGVQLKSTDIRPIKATRLALDTIRANEIAIIPKQVK